MLAIRNRKEFLRHADFMQFMIKLIVSTHLFLNVDFAALLVIHFDVFRVIFRIIFRKIGFTRKIASVIKT